MRGILLRALVLAALPACVVHLHPTGPVVVRQVKVPQPPPPPPRVVVVKGTCPSAGHVWIAGHYEWEANAYVWVKGRWVVPPRGKRGWRAGTWHKGAWTPGRWE